MSWLYLLLAGLFEIVWAYAMKQSNGFTRLDYTGIMLVTMLASFVLLALAMRSLPLGTAYAVWTGIGAVGAFAVGVMFLAEPLNMIRMLAVFLILAGIVMLKFS
jgi:quaternary ammonium compound-resistance protein SugE